MNLIKVIPVGFIFAGQSIKSSDTVYRVLSVSVSVGLRLIRVIDKGADNAVEKVTET